MTILMLMLMQTAERGGLAFDWTVSVSDLVALAAVGFLAVKYVSHINSKMERFEKYIDEHHEWSQKQAASHDSMERTLHELSEISAELKTSITQTREWVGDVDKRQSQDRQNIFEMQQKVFDSMQTLLQNILSARAGGPA